ncbi:tRNA pseudouridine(38/39) synthase isoform X2 [Fasciola gigantica]|uniref:tRNA pseudouridine synthase n=1 Tax=Fasciola gigantica TaxID=46835 RepID=A0A504YE60_FASGI|nr:tRNA pseudouridine(38/39) synthase isoform X2 [Fasciola gigantica]
MRIFAAVMRRFGELQKQLESLTTLSKEDLLVRAVTLERRNFELENIIKKLSTNTEYVEHKRRPFDFNKYKKRHIALQFAYLGWEYSGLAIQKGYPATVMQKLLESLEKCKLIEDANTHQFVVCGRTDKGVSAMSQVVSMTVRSALLSGIGIINESEPSSSSMNETALQELDYVFLLNRVLPRDIRIIAWSPVDPDFNARFSCLQRGYSYFLPLSGLDIKDAALRLVGTHDFRNFCSSSVEEGPRTFVRRIDRVDVRFSDQRAALFSDAHSMIEIDVSASGFLYHQIRCMVSILVMVGRGLESPQIVDELLDLTRTPAKPQYQMADDLPLLFVNATYPENAVKWETSPTAQSDLIRHFQRLSTEHAIRAVTVRKMLNHVEDRFPMNKAVHHQLDRIVPECRWREECDGKRAHKPIAKRQVEPTIEEKWNRAKRKKRDSAQGDGDSVPTVTEDISYNQ